MNNLKESKQEVLTKGFNLNTAKELFKTNFNLLGFFETLNLIEYRIKKERSRKGNSND